MQVFLKQCVFHHILITCHGVDSDERTNHSIFSVYTMIYVVIVLCVCVYTMFYVVIYGAICIGL